MPPQHEPGRRAFLLTALLALLHPGPVRAQPAVKIARVGISDPPRRGPSPPASGRSARACAASAGSTGRTSCSRRATPTNDTTGCPPWRRSSSRSASTCCSRWAPAIHAAKSTTATIPIVMETHGDAISSGLVSSLARPGGNVTGVSGFAPELNGKRLELIRELLPAAKRVGVIANRSNPATTTVIGVIEATAQQLRVQLQLADVRTPTELARAFEAVTRPRCDAVLVVTDPMLASQRSRIVELAARHRLPAVYDGAAWTDTAGLLSYGPLPMERFQRAAVYVDRILKGARPGDLPIEQPSTFELVLNLRTARGLGLDIPAALLVRAARVIE